MFLKIILISGAPGIQHWKVAAKIQQWQVCYFPSFKPKSSKDINSSLVSRSHSEIRRIHIVQSWTFKRWLFNIQRSAVVIYKYSDISNCHKVILKVILKILPMAFRRTWNYFFKGNATWWFESSYWVATLDADPAADWCSPSNSLSCLYFSLF